MSKKQKKSKRASCAIAIALPGNKPYWRFSATRSCRKMAAALAAESPLWLALEAQESEVASPTPRISAKLRIGKAKYPNLIGWLLTVFKRADRMNQLRRLLHPQAGDVPEQHAEPSMEVGGDTDEQPVVAGVSAELSTEERFDALLEISERQGERITRMAQELAEIRAIVCHLRPSESKLAASVAP